VPRTARVIFENVPHHVTQRGVNRSPVFIECADADSYLGLLRDYSQRYSVDVAAYCLMPNHVHLVLVPSTPDGLHLMLKSVHGRYARRFNRIKDRVGHLWQNRFFSSPLDASYFLNAVRYVELNPVRARLVARAEDYGWSSAAAHCGLRNDRLVGFRPRSVHFQGIEDWSGWLAGGLEVESAEVLRRNAHQNMPCGSTGFVDDLERLAGRELKPKGRGRPRRFAG
jgi:putative transposase